MEILFLTLQKFPYMALAELGKLERKAPEPVSAGELYVYLTGDRFANELPGVSANYDCWTEYVKFLAEKGIISCLRQR